MQILKKVRKMTCLYFAPVQTGTELQFAMPVECKCRWDEKSTVVRLRKGGEYLSGSMVLLDRLVEEDGYLWRGTLAEFTAQNREVVDPREIPTAKIIKKTETVPLLKAKSYSNMNNLAHWAYL